MYITEIRKEADFVNALQTFHANCITNKTILELTEADQAEIGVAATDAQAQLNNWEEARTAAKAAVVTKNETLKDSHAVVSKFAKIFNSNEAVPDSILAQLLLPPHFTPRTNTPPTQPLDPFANSDGLGNIELRWKRNGNRSGTVFLIEYRTSASADWTLFGSTTKAKFFTTWTPGSYIEFRISAQRGSYTSIASNSVVLWSGSSSATTLELQAA